MSFRTTAGRLLAGLAVSLLLAGCAAGSSPSQAPATAAPIATPSAAAATPKPTSEPSGRTLVSGLMECEDTDRDPAESPLPTAEVLSNGVSREWLDFTCTYAMSDPRVSGTERYLYRGALAELPDLPAILMFWDYTPLVLNTSGGTWKGVGMGVDYYHEPTLHTVGYTIYQGEGAYAGLEYTLMWSRKRDYVGEPYLVSGWIEPKQ